MLSFHLQVAKYVTSFTYEDEDFLNQSKSIIRVILRNHFVHTRIFVPCRDGFSILHINTNIRLIYYIGQSSKDGILYVLKTNKSHDNIS